jgi:hypothetical protein
LPHGVVLDIIDKKCPDIPKAQMMSVQDSRRGEYETAKSQNHISTQSNMFPVKKKHNLHL